MPGLRGHVARPDLPRPDGRSRRAAQGARRHEHPGAGPDPRPARYRTGTGANTRTLDAELLDRATRDDYQQWLRTALAAGAASGPSGCAAPSATSTPRPGRSSATWTPTNLPDKAIYLPCGDRRASVCPPCAETYRADTYQLIRAGLAGGKGVPESVAIHPCVFATFTAPSFGPVHTRVDHPRREGGPLPPPAQGQLLPARAAHLLRAAAPRRRPLPGQAAVPGLLRLPRSGRVERARPRAVAPHRHRHPPPPGQTRQGHTACGSSCPTPRSPSSSAAA